MPGAPPRSPPSGPVHAGPWIRALPGRAVRSAALPGGFQGRPASEFAPLKGVGATFSLLAPPPCPGAAERPRSSAAGVPGPEVRCIAVKACRYRIRSPRPLGPAEGAPHPHELDRAEEGVPPPGREAREALPCSPATPARPPRSPASALASSSDKSSLSDWFSSSDESGPAARGAPDRRAASCRCTSPHGMPKKEDPWPAVEMAGPTVLHAEARSEAASHDDSEQAAWNSRKVRWNSLSP